MGKLDTLKRTIAHNSGGSLAVRQVEKLRAGRRGAGKIEIHRTSKMMFFE